MMTRFRAPLALAIGILVVAHSRSTVAQLPTQPQGVVSGSGVAVIKRQPELMRMRLEVTASGKDMADALAKLKARREAAVKVCSTLGAAAATLSVGAPHIAAENPQQQQMMMMIRQRARNGARGAKKPGPTPVNVAALLTAEWPLKAADGEELLIATQSLQTNLKSELVKSMPKEELSPEEEEMQEEAAQEMGNYNNGMGPKPGEPTFLFMAKISNADYVKTAAQAFAMAKAHAQRMADAAGIPLGELRSLEGNDRQSMAMMNYSRPYYANGMMQDEDSAEQETTKDDEALGANPSDVRLSITIGASFAVGK